MIKSQIQKIKDDFQSDPGQYYFVSPTNFNLIDIHRWVKNWSDINFNNCYDDNVASCFIPEEPPGRAFSSLEDVNEHLLRTPSVMEKIANETKDSPSASIIFLFFNKALEEACKSLNLDLILPSNELVKNIDNKITTTEIGNEAGVPSVDNFLASVDSYSTLLELAKEKGLGERLVVQTPFGDSGKTTFFISSEEDYKKHSAKIEQEKKVKVMKQINCVGGAIEACATRAGTFVGPLLGELIGFPELTPYKGGWCGNELHSENFNEAIRKEVHLKTEKLGEALYKRGYRGYFEVDYLVDLDTADIYLGEINPRITGISAMTNTSHFCQNTIPLFLFHLLEYSKKSIEISPADYNSLSLSEGHKGCSSQMILKADHEDLRKVTKAPVSGIYTLDDMGQLHLKKACGNPTERSNDPEEAFLMRIIAEEQFSYFGADKMILFLNIPITQNQGMEINDAAQKWIKAGTQAFQTRELTDEEKSLSERFTSPSAIKGEDS